VLKSAFERSTALQVAEELSEVAVVVEQPSCVGIVRTAQ